MRTTIALVFCVLLAGCSSTFVVQTIRNPAVPGIISDAHRVAVVALYSDPQIRRLAEDKLVNHNPTFEPTYPFLTASIIAGSPEIGREALRENGFNYCLSMGLQKVQYYPHQVVSHAYRIEIKLYDLQRSEVIWYSVMESNTPQPFSVAALEVLDHVVIKLREEGFYIVI
jgi:PBP1b-binding outer membrane lipoprotein LpoB